MLSDADLRTAYALPDRERERVRMNFVTSADGAVTLEGRSGSLGGDTDRRLMQVLRTMADVVLVGAGTVRAEGYGGLHVTDEDARRRRADGLSDQPVLAIVSGRLDLEPDDAVFTEAVRPPILFTTDARADARRAEFADVADLVGCGDGVLNLRAMLAALAARGCAQVLCEGGPGLFGTLLDAGLVDEVCLTVSPRFVGGAAGRIVRGAAEADRGFRLEGILSDDEGFAFLRYRRPDS